MCRTRPLPQRSLRGRYRISPRLIADTQRALRVFDDAGRADGGHEGICYWAGREEPAMTHLEVVIVPSAIHRRFGVFVSEAEFARTARRARSMGLGILGQVHSHPGKDTRHSDRDDDLIVMPFENMLSIVAPCYGRVLFSISDFGIHQFQDHRWVFCNGDSILTAFSTDSII